MTKSGKQRKIMHFNPNKTLNQIMILPSYWLSHYSIPSALMLHMSIQVLVHKVRSIYNLKLLCVCVCVCFPSGTLVDKEIIIVIVNNRKQQSISDFFHIHTLQLDVKRSLVLLIKVS